MLLLWIAVPESAYGGGDLETKLFMTDVERGYRIYMPMFFGILLIFYLHRSMWIRFAWWKPVATIIAFILLLMIYKQRAAIAGITLAVAVGAILSLKRWRLAAFAGLGLACAVGAMVFLARSQTTSGVKISLGASLAVREISVAAAWDYISSDPLRWIIGVGGTTRLGDVTLGKLFNNPMFFLADIGWLGVLFEYGLIGVMLMLLVHVVGLRFALRWAQPEDPLSQALADYIVYLLAVSVVYSVVFTPGELMTVMALSYYLSRLSAVRPDGHGTDLAQASNPMPRHKAMAKALPFGLSGGPPSGIASKG
jgi:O-antigen ligase